MNVFFIYPSCRKINKISEIVLETHTPMGQLHFLSGRRWLKLWHRMF